MQWSLENLAKEVVRHFIRLSVISLTRHTVTQKFLHSLSSFHSAEFGAQLCQCFLDPFVHHSPVTVLNNQSSESVVAIK